jgi:hypothetical protein
VVTPAVIDGMLDAINNLQKGFRGVLISIGQNVWELIIIIRERLRKEKKNVSKKLDE